MIKFLERCSEMWSGIAALCRRFPYFFLALTVILTFYALWGTGRIVFEDDPTAYIPESDPDVAHWLNFTRDSGSLRTLIVGLEDTGDRPFDEDTLHRLSSITKKIEDLKKQGVRSARSLTNVSTIREGEDGILHADLMLSQFPRTERETERLKKRILSDSQVPGSFVSRDFKAYNIIVRIDEQANLAQVAQIVMKITEAERGPLKAYYFGGPFVQLQIVKRVLDALPWLVPIFALVLVAGAFWSARRKWQLALMAIAVAIPLLWCFGLHGLLDMKMDSTSGAAAIPLVLFGAITFASASRKKFKQEDSVSNRPVFPAADMGKLMICAGMFLLLSFLPLGHLNSFAFSGALGLFCLMLFVPIGFLPLLTVLSRNAERSPYVVANVRAIRISPKKSLVLALAIVLAFSVFLPSLRIYTDMEDLFSANSPTRQANRFFDRYFGGSVYLQIDFKADMRAPANVKRVEEVEEQLMALDDITDVRCIAQILRYLSLAMNRRDQIPPEREQLKNLWFFLEGNEDILPLVSPERDRAFLVARIRPQRFADYQEERAYFDALIHQAEEVVRPLHFENARGRLVHRLKNVASIYKLDLDAVVIESAVSKADQPFSNATKTAAVKNVHEYLQSDLSPLDFNEAESLQLAQRLLDGATDGELKEILRNLDEDNDFSDDSLDSIVAMLHSLERRQQEESHVAVVSAMLPIPESLPNASVIRSRIEGLFYDFLQQKRTNSSLPAQLEVKVSGFPVVKPGIEHEQMVYLFLGLAACLLILVGSLLPLILSGSRKWLMPLLLAVMIPAATLAFVVLTGLQIDSTTIAIFLALPPLGVIVSQVRTKNAPDVAAAFQSTRKVMLTLAVAFLTFQIVPVLPIHRLGWTLTFALATSAAFSWIAQRIEIRNGEKPDEETSETV